MADHYLYGDMVETSEAGSLTLNIQNALGTMYQGVVKVCIVICMNRIDSTICPSPRLIRLAIAQSPGPIKDHSK